MSSASIVSTSLNLSISSQGKPFSVNRLIRLCICSRFRSKIMTSPGCTRALLAVLDWFGVCAPSIFSCTKSVIRSAQRFFFASVLFAETPSCSFFCSFFCRVVFSKSRQCRDTFPPCCCLWARCSKGFF